MANNEKQVNVAIVGGGIIGLTTALALQQSSISKRLSSITIISEQWTPNTTGDVSAGLIYPYLTGPETPSDLMEQIFVDTMKFYTKLLNESDSGRFGVSSVNLFGLFRNENEVQKPIASHMFPFVKDLSENELKTLFPEEFKHGILVNTYIAEPKLFLPHLMEQFKAQNGRTVTGKIARLDSLLDEYDLIINCTGIGARELQDVHDDQLQSARGQVIRVRAPWIRQAVMADQWYILPQSDCIVLGGTSHKDNYSLLPYSDIANMIFMNCCRLIPSLAGATRIGDFVGLRPYRTSLRIEHDHRSKRIIHNYGHGGSGVTLCWGSALQVVRLVQQSLQEF